MKLAAPTFDQTELDNVKRVLDSGWVTQGPFVGQFEDGFGRYQETEFSLATTSCTAALHLAILALGVEPDDEVIVPAFTWITSANCAEYVGARAVFVDVDPVSFNIDVDKIEEKITERTRAIVPVHLFGLAADMEPILQLASRYNLKVIEDAACAIGTTYNGSKVGAIGDIGCFSFHPRKTITTGEGGMMTTSSGLLAEKLSSLRNHGASSSPANAQEKSGPWTMNDFSMLGYNLRLSDIQAAVGVAQLDKLERLLEERSMNAQLYTQMLEHDERIQTPSGEGHAYQSYVVRLPEASREVRNQIMTRLMEKNIPTRPGTHCVTNTTYYREKYGFKPSDHPVATSLEDETITLPMFPGMKKDEIELVVDQLLKL